MDDLNSRADTLREEMLEGVSDDDLAIAMSVFNRIMINGDQLQNR